MWQCECVGSWWQRSNDIGNRDGGKSRGLHALQARTKTLLACSMVCGIGGGNDFDLLFPQIVVSVCLHGCVGKRIGNQLFHALAKSRWRIRAWRAAEDPAGPADSRNTALSPVWSGPPRAARITRMPASSSPPRLHWQGLSTPQRRHLDDTTSPAAGHCSRPSSPARPNPPWSSNNTS